MLLQMALFGSFFMAEMTYFSLWHLSHIIDTSNKYFLTPPPHLFLLEHKLQEDKDFFILLTTKFSVPVQKVLSKYMNCWMNMGTHRA